MPWDGETGSLVTSHTSPELSTTERTEAAWRAGGVCRPSICCVVLFSGGCVEMRFLELKYSKQMKQASQVEGDADAVRGRGWAAESGSGQGNLGGPGCSEWPQCLAQQRPMRLSRD